MTGKRQIVPAPLGGQQIRNAKRELVLEAVRVMVEHMGSGGFDQEFEDVRDAWREYQKVER